MIFISGVHGVGKSYFCNIVKERTGIESYSASRLISERKKQGFPASKLIPDIDENQQYLLEAVAELRSSGQEFIIDGHFCLLNGEGNITRIGINTFTTLNPDAIILLTEEPEVIAGRRKARDGVDHPVEEIRDFQDEESSYATEVSKLLGVPLKISQGNSDTESTIDFIVTGRSMHGRKI